MKKFEVVVLDLGLILTNTFDAVNAEEAEADARETLAPELDCFPEDLEVVSVTEVQ